MNNNEINYENVFIKEENCDKISSFVENNTLCFRIPKKKKYKQYMKLLKKIVF